MLCTLLLWSLLFMICYLKRGFSDLLSLFSFYKGENLFLNNLKTIQVSSNIAVLHIIQLTACFFRLSGNENGIGTRSIGIRGLPAVLERSMRE